MKKRYRWIQIALLLLGFYQAVPLFAAPDFQNVKVFEDAEQGTFWTLLGDREDPRLYYRFPDAFTVKTDATGRPLVRSVQLANGDVRLSLLWGARDQSQDEARLRPLIRLKDGVEPNFVDLVPQLERFEIDPDLREPLARELIVGFQERLPLYLLPDEAFVLELTIPKAAVNDFLRRVVAGSGFTLFLQLYYRISDSRVSTTPIVFPFASSLLISGLRVCDLKPQLPCGGFP